MAVVTWVLHVRQQRRIDVLEGRVANLVAGVSLLTDTAESGLHDVTAEVARLSSAPSTRSRSRTTAHGRIAGAAKRGRSVREIAAAEQISEGEVKLRLRMSGAEDQRHAALR